MFSTNRELRHTDVKYISRLLAIALALQLVPAAYAKKDKNRKKNAEPAQQQVKIDTSQLVWPQPPDIARIRYVAELLGEVQPVSKTPSVRKQGWMDRLAGIQVQDTTQAKPRHSLAKPYGVVVDSKGKLYVADSFVGAIFIFNTETKEVSFIRNGVEARFKTIVGLAIDDNDRLFVVDSALHQVSVFDKDRKLESKFGANDLVRPGGAAIDVENRFVYVVDTEKENVAVFDADSFKHLRDIGGHAKKPGDEDPGTFAKPTNVAVDSEGNVYVTDTMNNRVQIFDADGNFISAFGKQGDGPGTFERPKGIAVDSDGHIWVVDAMQNRVQIFDKEGHLLAYFGEGGSYPGQFGLPAGVFIDKSNRVFVTEQAKGRVQVFRYITEAEANAEKEERAKNRATPQRASAVSPAAQTAAVQK